MVRVLRPEALDHLVLAVVPQEGEVDLDDVRTRFNDTHDSVRFLHLLLSRQTYDFHLLVDQRVFGFDARRGRSTPHFRRSLGPIDLT